MRKIQAETSAGLSWDSAAHIRPWVPPHTADTRYGTAPVIPELGRWWPDDQKFRLSLGHKRACFKWKECLPTPTKLTYKSFVIFYPLRWRRIWSGLPCPPLGPGIRMTLLGLWKEAHGTPCSQYRWRKLIPVLRATGGRTVTQCEPGDGKPLGSGLADAKAGASFLLAAGQLC